MRVLIIFILIAVSQTGIAQSFTEKVSSFERLSVTRGIEATLYSSDSRELEFQISGIDREDVIIEEVNGKLRLKVSSEGLWEQIEEDDGWWVKVKIPYQSLLSLEVNTGAEVYVKDPIKSEQLDIEVSMGGELDANVESGSLFVQNTMGGIVEVTGTVEEFDVSSNMGAVTDASDLQAEFVRGKANMGGELKVHAKESFSGKASMGGYIRVYGNPERFRDSPSMGGEISNARH